MTVAVSQAAGTWTDKSRKNLVFVEVPAMDDGPQTPKLNINQSLPDQHSTAITNLNLNGSKMSFER